MPLGSIVFIYVSILCCGTPKINLFSTVFANAKRKEITNVNHAKKTKKVRYAIT